MRIGLGRFLTRLLGNASAKEPRRPSPPRGQWPPPIPERPLREVTTTHVTTGPDGRYVNGVFTPLDVEDMGNGIWAVESESSLGDYYYVEVDDEHGWTCPCRDYQAGRQGWKRGVITCKHIGMVIVRSGLRPSLTLANVRTGEFGLANDNFVDWYVSEGIGERHGIYP